VPYQPRATFDNPYGPQVSFRTIDVLPPAAYYVGLDDQIVFEVFTDNSNSSYQLVVRVLNPQGTIQVETLTLNNFQVGYQTVTGRLTGMEGYILSGCISAPGVAAGESYCRVRLMRAPYLTTGVATGMLIAGYVSDKYSLSYPATLPRPPMEGPSKIVSISATAATGAEWVIPCPQGERWRILGASFSLTTSAAVATRLVVIGVNNNAGIAIGFFVSPTTQAASLAQNYSVNPGGTAISNLVWTNISASAEVWINDGGNMHSFTENLQAGDQYTGVTLQIQKWVGV